MENNCYIYVHYRGDNLSPFYVGKGTRQNKNTYKSIYQRAYLKARDNKYWNRIVNKVGYHVLIIHDNLTETQAFKMETSYINWFGRENLVNFTDGGDGCSGYKHTEEAKKKIGEATSNRIPWNKGLNGFEGEKNNFYGKTHTEETKKKISIINTGNISPRRKKIINLESGEIFSCITEVAEKNNIPRTTLNAKLTGRLNNNTPFRYYE
jgi:group I intron endonuclease